jgi:two-component system sensor histidine kinase UhpB
MEKRYRHRQGHLVWGLLSVSLVRDAEGRPLYFVSQVQDITARKRDEAALETSRQEVLRLASRLMSAHEEERRLIARDLHDDLGQDVAVLSMSISNLRRRPGLPEAVVQALGDVLGRVNQLAGSVRQLSHELHPAWIEHMGLGRALRAFVAEFGDTSGVEIALATPEREERIPADVRTCVLRVVQECVRNIARHSGARRAEIVCAIEGARVELAVRDDGRGFDPAGVRQGASLGLITIEERVRLLQGYAEVRSKPGAGTEVFVSIPLPAAPPTPVAAGPDRETES